jgi:hypothetical protein
MKVELNEQQVKTALYTVKPHHDIELDTKRIDIDYYVSRPNQINAETGVILSITGFGFDARSPYIIQKLNPYLANKYNCIVVSLNYFGIFRGNEIVLSDEFTQQMKNIYGVPKSYWKSKDSNNDIILKIASVLKEKGVNSIDPRCQITGITERDEYQSFGFLPALDCLTVLGDVLKRFPLINKKKIIAYGSSYGGYIAMLCGKYAPNTFSIIIDNSGFSRAELKYIAGYQTLLVDYAPSVIFEGEEYKLIKSFNNPWTITDETSPQYFGDSHKLIRNLFVQDHRKPSETRYYTFHCVNDDIASVEDKDKVVQLLSCYNQTYYKRVTEHDIDGQLFKSYEHSMKASLRKLFDHVAELDNSNKLMKESSKTDFDNETKYTFNCGEKNYVFIYSKDKTLRVKINENVKKNYQFIPHLMSMDSVIILTKSFLKQFEVMQTHLHKKEYAASGKILEDILSKYDDTMKKLELFISVLPSNNIQTVNDELISAFSALINLYEQGQWDAALNLLSKKVLSAFKNWRSELIHVIEPLI